MRIAIVYNEPLPTQLGDRSETGVVAQAADIARALVAMGKRPAVRGVVSGSDLVEFVTRERADVIFNCCESLCGDAALEVSVAALFELLGTPYTGSPPLTLGLALHKGVAKAILQAHGIPAPAGVVVETAADLQRVPALTFPLIVKPVAQDASIGIGDDSLVYDAATLAARAAFIWREFEQAALVEEFIDGRELNVALLADTEGHLQPLPVSEVTFDALPAGMPRIVGYDAKWSVDSAAYAGTPVQCPAALDPVLAERVPALAVAAARAVGVRDYGRVDLRVRSRDGALFVLEVNPNPDLSADAGFMRAAQASGRTFAATIDHILTRAVDRSRRRDTAAGVR